MPIKKQPGGEGDGTPEGLEPLASLFSLAVDRRMGIKDSLAVKRLKPEMKVWDKRISEKVGFGILEARKPEQFDVYVQSADKLMVIEAKSYMQPFEGKLLKEDLTKVGAIIPIVGRKSMDRYLKLEEMVLSPYSTARKRSGSSGKVFAPSKVAKRKSDASTSVGRTKG